jgi:hypothetical protein
MSMMEFHNGAMHVQSNDVFQSYFKFKLEVWAKQINYKK